MSITQITFSARWNPQITGGNQKKPTMPPSCRETVSLAGKKHGGHLWCACLEISKLDATYSVAGM